MFVVIIGIRLTVQSSKTKNVKRGWEKVQYLLTIQHA